MRFGQTSKHLQILIELLNKHEKSLFPVFTSVDYHLSWYTDAWPDHTNYLTCWCLLPAQRTAEWREWRGGWVIPSHSFNWVWSSSFFFIRLLSILLDIFGPKVESGLENGSYGSCNVNTDQMVINLTEGLLKWHLHNWGFNTLCRNCRELFCLCSGRTPSLTCVITLWWWCAIHKMKTY